MVKRSQKLQMIPVPRVAKIKDHKKIKNCEKLEKS
jgi:hypothetical protein